MMLVFNEENIVCLLVFCVCVFDVNWCIFFKYIFFGVLVVFYKWIEMLIKFIFLFYMIIILLQEGSGGMVFIDWVCLFYFEM